MVYGIPLSLGSPRILDEMVSAELIGKEQARALRELLTVGDAQAHGEQITAGLAAYAMFEGGRLLHAVQELTKSEVRIVDEICLRAKSAGKDAKPYGGGPPGSPSYVDILIPNELVVWVRPPPHDATQLQPLLADEASKQNQVF